MHQFRQTRRIRSLDGLRALAILSVLVSRTAPLRNSNIEGLGLEIFFALSGYANTVALLGGQDWREFYCRRALRILTLYGLVLLYVMSSPFTGSPWWSLLTFNVDVGMISVPPALWAPSAAVALWVICVEAKGIALLPWLLRERRTLRLLIGLSLLSRCVISAECALHWHAEGVVRAAGTFFLCRLDGILLGAEAALQVQEGSGFLRSLSEIAWPLLLFRGVLVVTPVGLWEPTYTLIILPIGLVAATASVVRLATAARDVPILSWGPLVWLGTVAWEVYLLHGVTSDLVAPVTPGARSWTYCGKALAIAIVASGTIWCVFQRSIPAELGGAQARTKAESGVVHRNRTRGFPFAAAVALAVVLACQVLIVGISTLTPVPTHGDVDRSYYERLAMAFSHGQTSLLQAPAPELLALADPYDPTTLAAIGGWVALDASHQQRRRQRTVRVIVFLALVTCVIGVLLGFTGFYPRIHGWNQFVRDVTELAGMGPA